MRLSATIASWMLSAGLATSATVAIAEDWPTRPIENSIWSSAGGGTDFTNRLISKALEEPLGVRVNAVNRTGGGGSVAMHHVWSQPRDGYALLGASEAMQNVAVMGFHDTTTKDWRWYMVGGSPGSIAVRGDSPYQTIEDLISAAKATPGAIKLSHCATGCVWHLKSLSLADAAGVDFNMIPYEGSAPAMVAVLNGESDLVVSSIQEQSEYIKAGKMRSLGMIEMEPFDFPGIGLLPALGETYPGIQRIPARQWLGFAIPGDTPAPVVAELDAAFEQAINNPDVQARLEERLMAVMGHYGDDSLAILQDMESAVSWKLWDLGIAKISPEEFGIPKPE